MICVACGKVTEVKDTRGYLKHPYCTECFSIVWKDRFDWYDEWMGKYHDAGLMGNLMTVKKFVARKERGK